MKTCFGTCDIGTNRPGMGSHRAVRGPNRPGMGVQTDILFIPSLRPCQHQLQDFAQNLAVRGALRCSTPKTRIAQKYKSLARGKQVNRLQRRSGKLL